MCVYRCIYVHVCNIYIYMLPYIHTHVCMYVFVCTYSYLYGLHQPVAKLQSS